MKVRRFGEAITTLEQGVKISQQIGDRHTEGTALTNLGVAVVGVRRFEEAIIAYEHAITICVELGDQYGQAQTLENLGALHTDLDNPETARRARADAIELYLAAGTADADGVRQQIPDLDR